MPSGRDLTRREVREIMERDGRGQWPAQIARDLGLCRQTVVKVIKNSHKSSPR